jgi:hypothetical protein
MGIIYAVIPVTVADLQLAAELGKALLERNIDLENQLHNVQVTYNEQVSELSVST